MGLHSVPAGAGRLGTPHLSDHAMSIRVFHPGVAVVDHSVMVDGHIYGHTM
jgi:hypothetical protein